MSTCSFLTARGSRALRGRSSARLNTLRSCRGSSLSTASWPYRSTSRFWMGVPVTAHLHATHACAHEQGHTGSQVGPSACCILYACDMHILPCAPAACQMRWCPRQTWTQEQTPLGRVRAPLPPNCERALLEQAARALLHSINARAPLRASPALSLERLRRLAHLRSRVLDGVRLVQHHPCARPRTQPREILCAAHTDRNWTATSSKQDGGVIQSVCLACQDELTCAGWPPRIRPTHIVGSKPET